MAVRPDGNSVNDFISLRTALMAELGEVRNSDTWEFEEATRQYYLSRIQGTGNCRGNFGRDNNILP